MEERLYAQCFHDQDIDVLAPHCYSLTERDVEKKEGKKQSKYSNQITYPAPALDLP